MDSPFIHKALLHEPVNGKVRCLTCERRCLLGDGQVGWCHTRQNWGGTIYTLTYGLVSSLSANPIEKKPLHHFYPGSVALTAGSLSCNLDCPWCQNWRISKQAPLVIESEPQQSQSDCSQLSHPQHQSWGISQRPPSGERYLSPEDFVNEAVRLGCRGTSISFNEPTLSLEWSLEVFWFARQSGLYNTFVSNGYMTETALQHLVQAGLDGINIDVKGDTDAVRTHCQADVEIVWRNLRLAQESGIWIEITTLIVPGVNDDPTTLHAIAERIRGEVGPQTPWHVTRYSPAYLFSAPQTQIGKLEQARQIGRQAGLTYVYVGNVPNHAAESTFCPSCERLLIQRSGIYATSNNLRAGCCPGCGERVPGVGLEWMNGQVRDSFRKER